MNLTLVDSLWSLDLIQNPPKFLETLSLKTESLSTDLISFWSDSNEKKQMSQIQLPSNLNSKITINTLPKSPRSLL